MRPSGARPRAPEGGSPGWELSVEDLIGAKIEATILDMKHGAPPAPSNEAPAVEAAS